MDYRKMFDKDFLGDYDLTDAEGKPKDFTGTIAAVERGELRVKAKGDAKVEHKPIIFFEGWPKKLACNKTNAAQIAQLLGSSNTRDWIGKRVTMYATTTKFGPKTVGCIRIRPTLPGAKVANSAAPVGPAVEVHAEFTDTSKTEGTAA